MRIPLTPIIKNRRLRVIAIAAAAAAIIGFATNAAMEFGLIKPMYLQAIENSQARGEQLYEARIKAVESRGMTFDRRSEPQFLEEESARDPRMIKSQCAGDYNTPYFQEKGYLPLGGQSKVPTLAGKENGRYLTYVADQHGLRNPEHEWDVARSAEGTDIILLGASFAQGYLVSPDESISGRARARGYNVLNLGCNSNGPLKSLASLREFARNAKARHVIYLFGGAQYLKNMAQEIGHPVLIKYLDDPHFSQRLTDDQQRIDADIRANYDLWLANKENRQATWQRKAENDSVFRRLIFGRYLRTEAKYLINKLKANINDALPSADTGTKLSRIFQRMKQAAEAADAQLHLLYVPDISELYRPDSADARKDMILGAARALDIDVLDIEPALREIHPVDRLFDLGGKAELGELPKNYGPTAYQIIAERIDDHLKR